MSKYTPGPWHGEENFDTDGCTSLGITVRAGNKTIGSVWGIGEEDFANTRLIAAAPDLLAALRALLSDCERLGFEGRNTASVKQRARAAIASAGTNSK